MKNLICWIESTEQLKEGNTNLFTWSGSTGSVSSRYRYRRAGENETGIKR